MDKNVKKRKEKLTDTLEKLREERIKEILQKINFDTVVIPKEEFTTSTATVSESLVGASKDIKNVKAAITDEKRPVYAEDIKPIEEKVNLALEENEKLQNIVSIFTKGSAEEMKDRIGLAFLAKDVKFIEIIAADAKKTSENAEKTARDAMKTAVDMRTLVAVAFIVAVIVSVVVSLLTPLFSQWFA